MISILNIFLDLQNIFGLSLFGFCTCLIAIKRYVQYGFFRFRYNRQFSDEQGFNSNS